MSSKKKSSTGSSHKKTKKEKTKKIEEEEMELSQQKSDSEGEVASNPKENESEDKSEPEVEKELEEDKMEVSSNLLKEKEAKDIEHLMQFPSEEDKKVRKRENSHEDGEEAKKKKKKKSKQEEKQESSPLTKPGMGGEKIIEKPRSVLEVAPVPPIVTSAINKNDQKPIVFLINKNDQKPIVFDIADPKSNDTIASKSNQSTSTSTVTTLATIPAEPPAEVSAHHFTKVLADAALESYVLNKVKTGNLSYGGNLVHASTNRKVIIFFPPVTVVTSMIHGIGSEFVETWSYEKREFMLTVRPFLEPEIAKLDPRAVEYQELFRVQIIKLKKLVMDLFYIANKQGWDKQWASLGEKVEREMYEKNFHYWRSSGDETKNIPADKDDFTFRLKIHAFWKENEEDTKKQMIQKPEETKVPTKFQLGGAKKNVPAIEPPKKKEIAESKEQDKEKDEKDEEKMENIQAIIQHDSKLEDDDFYNVQNEKAKIFVREFIETGKKAGYRYTRFSFIDGQGKKIKLDKSQMDPNFMVIRQNDIIQPMASVWVYSKKGDHEYGMKLQLLQTIAIVRQGIPNNKKRISDGLAISAPFVMPTDD